MLSKLVIPPQVRLALKLAPYVVILILASALVMTRATLREARLTYAVEKAKDEAASAEEKASFAEKGREAAQAYAKKIEDRQPIILHSKETVTRYAQTTDGNMPCLPSDRVRGIEEDRDALFANSKGGASSLPADK